MFHVIIALNILSENKIAYTDLFVQEMQPDSRGYYPIICAEGTEGNTCGADSGKSPYLGYEG